MRTEGRVTTRVRDKSKYEPCRSPIQAASFRASSDFFRVASSLGRAAFVFWRVFGGEQFSADVMIMYAPLAPPALRPPVCSPFRRRTPRVDSPT